MMRFRHMMQMINNAAVALLVTLCGGLLNNNFAFAQDCQELYRIRIANRANGAVEVSLDKGTSYTIVGRVTRPATEVSRGYSASKYAQEGKVAAVAVHGIRIRVGSIPEKQGDTPLIISILPREFAQAPRGFGGHIAGSSGIVTNIPTGTAIFRNLAPFVGNQVFLEQRGVLAPLPSGYSPCIGDVLVILVHLPKRYAKEIIFENKTGGKVDAIYEDGTETIAIVKRPVHGVGRFDATGYTGVGQINTNHTGVITISTAPIANGQKDGSDFETRGGFMIQPSRHAIESGDSPQVCVVEPVSKDSQWLEGTPPLFSGYLSLAYDPQSKENSFSVDIQCGDGIWRSLPPLIGKQDHALDNLPGLGLPVTHIRIRLPRYDKEWIRQQLRQSLLAYKKMTERNVPTLTGKFTLSLDASGLPELQFVALWVDGQCKAISSVPPFTFEIDTSKLDYGEHIVEIKALDNSGKPLKTVTKRFFCGEP
ncbi:MAG: hypothetical protein QHH26_10900 [Armatimonadota bacterium]|nr:hypothetical protein [Armatimonadota bacterium]